MFLKKIATQLSLATSVKDRSNFKKLQIVQDIFSDTHMLDRAINRLNKA